MSAPSATDPAPTSWAGPIAGHVVPCHPSGWPSTLADPVANSVAGNPDLILSATLSEPATKKEERLDRIT